LNSMTYTEDDQNPTLPPIPGRKHSFTARYRFS
jgi:hypothetical protein